MPLPSTYVEGFHDKTAVENMRYRELPHYGKVSILSYGAAGIGGMHTAGKGTGLKGLKVRKNDPSIWFMEDPESDKERARELIHHAIKSGINLIDTSHWYGQGKSERLLGHALKDVPREAFYINSKIGRYDKNVCDMFDFTAERTYKAVLDSLERLQLEYIDCMQVHVFHDFYKQYYKIVLFFCVFTYYLYTLPTLIITLYISHGMGPRVCSKCRRYY